MAHMLNRRRARAHRYGTVSRITATSSGDGIDAIEARMRWAASAKDCSLSRWVIASRTASAVASPGGSERPAPVAATAAAFRNWSAPWGRHSWGTPWPSVARTVPEPACETTTSQWGRSRVWGIAFDPDVGSKRPERGRVGPRPDRHQHPGLDLGESGHDELERAGVVEDGAHRHVHERGAVGPVGEGEGGRAVELPVVGHRSQELAAGDVGRLRVLEPGRVDVEVEVIVGTAVRSGLEPSLSP